MPDLISEEKAAEIYQQLLDDIQAAYFANDFAHYRQMIHAPHTYSTKGGTLRIADYDQLLLSFQAFGEYLQGLGVTEFRRKCLGAAVLSADKFIGSHSTEFLRDGTSLREPYEVWATVERIDGRWVVTGSENAIEDTSWQAHAFRQGAERIHTPHRWQNNK